MFSSLQTPSVLDQEPRATHVTAHIQSVNKTLNHEFRPVTGSVTVKKVEWVEEGQANKKTWAVVWRYFTLTTYRWYILRMALNFNHQLIWIFFFFASQWTLIVQSNSPRQRSLLRETGATKQFITHWKCDFLGGVEIFIWLHWLLLTLNRIFSK